MTYKEQALKELEELIASGILKSFPHVNKLRADLGETLHDYARWLLNAPMGWNLPLTVSRIKNRIERKI
jgi:hypothetical protein